MSPSGPTPTPQEADQALIRRILAGGEDGKAAFRELYGRYRRQVFGLCYRLLGDYDRAADATQETFMAVLRGLASFGFQSSFRTWLFQVTKNAALQHLRRAGSRPMALLEEQADGADPAPLGEAPATQLAEAMDRELEADLQAALGRLKPHHAEILSLRYFADCSYEEIARVLGCSVGTVKSRLSRAHRAFRPHLEEVLRKHGKLPPGLEPTQPGDASSRQDIHRESRPEAAP